MQLTGDLSYSAGFNANGIAARGGWLVLVQGNEGLLFKVNPRTGETTEIDTGGYSVAMGDGLVLRGKTLYVVRNFANTVAVLTMRAGLTEAELVGEFTSEDFELDIPTTGTLTQGALWVVNARFSTPPTPDTRVLDHEAADAAVDERCLAAPLVTGELSRVSPRLTVTSGIDRDPRDSEGPADGGRDDLVRW